MHYSYNLFVKELGAKLKQMRKDRGWTLRDMVIKHHLHMTQWQRLESGKKGVSTRSLLQICEVFGVGLSQLVGELGQISRETKLAAKVVKKTTEAGPLSAKSTKGLKKASPRPGDSSGV